MKRMVLLTVALVAAKASFAGELASREIASIFEDNIDAREAFTASLNCQSELKDLSKSAYISNVSGKFKKVSKTVSTKTYTVTYATGGFAFGPAPERVGEVIITLTTTQPPDDVMDAPSTQEWSCKTKK